jgi:hypothetical protein
VTRRQKNHAGDTTVIEPELRGAARRFTTEDLIPDFYLQILRRLWIDALELDSIHPKTIAATDGTISTVHFAFYEAIRSAVDTLRGYLEDPSARRPMNCLLLGAPGSGKSSLAQAIGKATGIPALYLEYNLSRCDGTEQVGAIFDEIVGMNQRFKQPKVVLLDEFDVRLGGTSMIRYLIQPIYDGKLGEGRELGKTAFIFSGGTLRDRQTLRTLQRNAADFDLIKFLYEVYGGSRLEMARSQMVRDFLDATIKYRDARDRMAPGRDTIEFLRRLDKLPDFLSRINGFVIELPDLSDPAGITHDPLLLGEEDALDDVWPRDRDIRAQRMLQQQLIEMVEAAERVENAELGERPLADFQTSTQLGEESDRLGKEAERLKASDSRRSDRLKERQKELDTMIRDAKSWEDRLRHCRYSYSFRTHREPLLVYKSMLLVERYYRVLINLARRFGPLQGRADPSRPVVIRTSLLNYLCMVPLQHGLRSLEFLIRMLSLAPERCTHLDGAWVVRIHLDPSNQIGPLFRMHMRDELPFRDPDMLWRLVRDRNPKSLEKIAREASSGANPGFTRPPWASGLPNWADILKAYPLQDDPDVLVRIWKG